MILLDTYRELVATSAIDADPAQAAAVARLETLAQELRRWRRRSGLSALLGGNKPAPKGVYLYGPVGRGKTMLMDLFYQATRFRPKRRIHFHEFMADVQERMATARKMLPGDPIPHVAADLAAKAGLLCFDEMHVTDIADAMILERLFKAMLDAQVVVVATSNVHPRDLYKNGLNRQLFLPFIDLVEQRMDVLEVEAARDFRLGKLSGKPLYFTPVNAAAREGMDRLWGELTGHHPGAPAQLEVKGRKVRVPLAAMGVARFTFADLCEQPLGNADYLTMAHTFHTLFIDNIPVLGREQREVSRRFVNLIDTLYDNRVCLVASAAAEPEGLFAVGGDSGVPFERTVSRLTEMRSQGYLADRSERASTRAPVVGAPVPGGG